MKVQAIAASSDNYTSLLAVQNSTLINKRTYYTTGSFHQRTSWWIENCSYFDI